MSPLNLSPRPHRKLYSVENSMTTHLHCPKDAKVRTSVVVTGSISGWLVTNQQAIIHNYGDVVPSSPHSKHADAIFISQRQL